ncbi:TM0106 family RecB-like putative nuclease [Propioniciclava sp.]|uniref:TM0106 family RecB-like putative nuclease n=1 Tax=Propioniciclava sp. TaxID=2038686 RepID=UPI0039E34CC0
MLQACGYAAPLPWAGLIGVDRLNTAPSGRRAKVEPVIAWLDLDQPRVPPNPRTVPVPAEAAPISALARYDAEHRYRVDIARAARAGIPPQTLITPVISAECRGCVWQQHCQAQLDPDDLSLRITKAPLDVHELRALREFGITTVAQLAASDLPSLTERFLRRTSHRDGGEVRLQRAHHRARLLSAGIEVERQTTGPLHLPQHDLEVDIDIETSASDRLYLWGFRVHDRTRGESFTRQFGAFTDLDAAGEAALAVEALRWLRGLVDGRDAAAYHYSDYETIRLARLAPKLGELGTWATTWASAHFVDLFPMMRAHFFGANGLGLKAVVTAVTGFAWRDEDPGGLNSLSWFAEAVGDPDPEARARARVRVLEYNEDDVLATWHLRRWLRSLT